MSTPVPPADLKRRQQLVQTYKMARKSDPRIGLWILLAFVVAGALAFLVFSLLPGPGLVWGIIGGLLFGLLRRGWKVDPAVGFTKQQDVVHRVVGPPGIVLVAEGAPARTKQLLTNERRKHERVAADIPIHEVVCGRGEGEVPLPKVVKHVTKLGRKVKPAEMTDLLYRLKALDANRSNVPLPKGPLPTSMKGQRGNLRGR